MSEIQKKITIQSLIRMKNEGKKSVFVTAYDYPTARRADRAGVDMILVGDSLGMTVLGYENTLPVTMDIMIPHADAVARAVQSAFVIGDMPYMTYQTSDSDAVYNASRFIRVGCSAVKCEGGKGVSSRIRAMNDAGILVMGHLGLTPQSMASLGGYKVQGRNNHAIEKLIEEANIIKDAGAFSILLEAIPPEAGKKIRDSLEIPIYGIGAGPYVDGQLLICHDLLGTFEGKLSKNVSIPRFAKRYAEIGKLEEQAFKDYAAEVRDGRFPSSEHCYSSDETKEDNDQSSPCRERK